jgi:hypothetical protein
VEAKEVLSKPAAVEQASLPPVEEERKPRFRFVKQHGVAQKLRFKDGTEFSFRRIKLNDGSGIAPSSEVVTEDATLAKNLRALAKTGDYGIVEIKI